MKVPKKTTKYNKEPIHEKYIIGFAPELISFIKEGKKVLTYRFGEKYNYLKPNDVVVIEDTVNKKAYGKAKVISKEKTTFDKLPLSSPGHETYKDKEHQRKVFFGYYAYLGRKIRDGDEFLILGFKLIK